MSQARLGELLGANRKTIGRWQTHARRFPPPTTLTLATALHPVDPDLAREVAELAGETLESLGIVAPVMAAPPRGPSLAHLVDAVVMAAVDANGGHTPQLRDVLLAAFQRAGAMGLTLADVAAGLTGAGAAARGAKPGS